MQAAYASRFSRVRVRERVRLPFHWLAFQGVAPWFESSATLLGGAPDYKASTVGSPLIGGAALAARRAFGWFGGRANSSLAQPPAGLVRSFGSSFRGVTPWFESSATLLGSSYAYAPDSLKPASRGVRTRAARTARSYKHPCLQASLGTAAPPRIRLLRRVAPALLRLSLPSLCSQGGRKCVP